MTFQQALEVVYTDIIEERITKEISGSNEMITNTRYGGFIGSSVDQITEAMKEQDETIRQAKMFRVMDLVFQVGKFTGIQMERPRRPPLDDFAVTKDR